MYLQDFIDIGFKEIFKDTSAIYRRLLKTDANYAVIQEFAKNNYKTYEDWDVVADYVQTFNYYLNNLYCSGDDVKEAVCYFNDNNGERVQVQKDDIILDIYYDKDTKLIYWIVDRFGYFSTFYQYSNGELYEISKDAKCIFDVSGVIMRLYMRRREDAQHVRNYYNKKLREIKKDYKDRLSKCNKGIKTLQQLCEYACKVDLKSI